MKVILVAVFLFSPALAKADCMQWGKDVHGNRVCMQDDLVNRNPIIPLDGVTNSAVPQLKCDDGEALVTYPGGSYLMCASSLKAAHR
jgi:hypothetical protein